MKPKQPKNNANFRSVQHLNTLVKHLQSRSPNQSNKSNQKDENLNLINNATHLLIKQYRIVPISDYNASKDNFEKSEEKSRKIILQSSFTNKNEKNSFFKSSKFQFSKIENILLDSTKMSKL